jgi:Zn-finger nucleic acid-binding protein
MRSQLVPSNSSDIERPTCPDCGQLMWIARITPDAPGYDKRTFDCPVCNISQTAVVRVGLKLNA